MKFEFSEPARAELEHARDHYEAEREGLGREFMLEMQRLARDLAERPLTFQLYPRTRYRRAVGTRFPYMLVFLLLPDTARVICVAHQHQKPRYWRGRA